MKLTTKQDATLGAILAGAGTVEELAKALDLSTSGARTRVLRLEKIAPDLLWTEMSIGNHYNPGLKQLQFGLEDEGWEYLDSLPPGE